MKSCKIIKLLLLPLLLFLSLPLYAEQSFDKNEWKAFCKMNPKRCNKILEKCNKKPERCQKLKASIMKKEKWCKKLPGGCSAKKSGRAQVVERKRQPL